MRLAPARGIFGQSHWPPAAKMAAERAGHANQRRAGDASARPLARASRDGRRGGRACKVDARGSRERNPIGRRGAKMAPSQDGRRGGRACKWSSRGSSSRNPIGRRPPSWAGHAKQTREEAGEKNPIGRPSGKSAAKIGHWSAYLGAGSSRGVYRHGLHRSTSLRCRYGQHRSLPTRGDPIVSAPARTLKTPALRRLSALDGRPDPPGGRERRALFFFSFFALSFFFFCRARSSGSLSPSSTRSPSSAPGARERETPREPIETMADDLFDFIETEGNFSQLLAAAAAAAAAEEEGTAAGSDGGSQGSRRRGPSGEDLLFGPGGLFGRRPRGRGRSHEAAPSSFGPAAAAAAAPPGLGRDRGARRRRRGGGRARVPGRRVPRSGSPSGLRARSPRPRAPVPGRLRAPAADPGSTRSGRGRGPRRPRAPVPLRSLPGLLLRLPRPLGSPAEMVPREGGPGR
nr:hypothetical protein [Suid alphaherpesvirus 1]